MITGLALPAPSDGSRSGLSEVSGSPDEVQPGDALDRGDRRLDVGDHAGQRTGRVVLVPDRLAAVERHRSAVRSGRDPVVVRRLGSRRHRREVADHVDDQVRRVDAGDQRDRAAATDLRDDQIGPGLTGENVHVRRVGRQASGREHADVAARVRIGNRHVQHDGTDLPPARQPGPAEDQHVKLLLESADADGSDLAAVPPAQHRRAGHGLPGRAGVGEPGRCDPDIVGAGGEIAGHVDQHIGRRRDVQRHLAAGADRGDDLVGGRRAGNVVQVRRQRHRAAGGRRSQVPAAGRPGDHDVQRDAGGAGRHAATPAHLELQSSAAGDLAGAGELAVDRAAPTRVRPSGTGSAAPPPELQ